MRKLPCGCKCSVTLTQIDMVWCPLHAAVKEMRDLINRLGTELHMRDLRGHDYAAEARALLAKVDKP